MHLHLNLAGFVITGSATACGTPEQVGTVTVTATKEGGVVHWLCPRMNGGSTVTSYLLKVSEHIEWVGVGVGVGVSVGISHSLFVGLGVQHRMRCMCVRCCMSILVQCFRYICRLNILYCCVNPLIRVFNVCNVCNIDWDERWWTSTATASQ